MVSLHTYININTLLCNLLFHYSVYVSTRHPLPSVKVHPFFASPGFCVTCCPMQVIFCPSYSMLLFRSSSKFSVSCDLFRTGLPPSFESNNTVSVGVGYALYQEQLKVTWSSWEPWCQMQFGWTSGASGEWDHGE